VNTINGDHCITSISDHVKLCQALLCVIVRTCLAAIKIKTRHQFDDIHNSWLSVKVHNIKYTHNTYNTISYYNRYNLAVEYIVHSMYNIII